MNQLVLRRKSLTHLTLLGVPKGIVTIISWKPFYSLLSVVLWIYLKASPLPPAPCQQATADWLSAEMVTFYTQNCHFGDLEAPFWCPEGPLW